MFFEKSRKKKKILSGNINKYPSYMMGIAESDEDIKDFDLILKNLRNCKTFKFLQVYNLEHCKEIKIEYKNEIFKVKLWLEEVEIPTKIRPFHELEKTCVERLKQKVLGITTEMIFSDNIEDSYHLQIKILNCMINNLIAIIDFSSEKILSGKWVKLVAESNIPPTPKYYYTVQVIYDDKKVWLHTHGLNRCGLIEIEILEADIDKYEPYYNLINFIARSAIGNRTLENEKQPFFVTYFSDNEPLVATWVRLEEALKKYNKNIIGGIEDRQDNHNKDTGIIYYYKNENNLEKGIYSHINDIDKYLSENLIFMLTNQETDRMRKLAIEKFDYVRNLFGKKEIQVLIKFGLLIDEEYRKDDAANLEHIWFDVLEIDNNKIKAELTQEPYWISGIKAGDVMELDFEQVTDWLIFDENKQQRISPDEVYLL